MNQKIILALVLLAVGGFVIWKRGSQGEAGGGVKAPPQAPAQGANSKQPSPRGQGAKRPPKAPEGRGAAEDVGDRLVGPDPARLPALASFTLPEVPYEKRGNQTVGTFGSAKKKLPDIFKGHEETFYCGCRYSEKTVDLASCGYTVRKDPKRAGRIEWEHVVPASAFGHTFKAWTEGHPRCYKRRKKYKGRKCVGEVSGLFQHMEADLYNLRPAIGEVNGNRSNYAMAIIDGEAREYGACDVEIDNKQVEPRPAIRGDIARTYLYMDWAYPNRQILDDQSRAMMLSWHKADPPTKAERAWAERVRAVQGNVNPFIQGER